jgi:hypothetical protein
MITESDNMTIKSSLDWQLTRAELDAQICATSHSVELRKMLKNIDNMVTDLSKLEVEARRTKSDRGCVDKIKEIEEAVTHLDQWLITAILMS